MGKAMAKTFSEIGIKSKDVETFNVMIAHLLRLDEETRYRLIGALAVFFKCAEWNMRR